MALSGSRFKVGARYVRDAKLQSRARTRTRASECAPKFPVWQNQGVYQPSLSTPDRQTSFSLALHSRVDQPLARRNDQVLNCPPANPSPITLQFRDTGLSNMITVLTRRWALSSLTSYDILYAIPSHSFVVNLALPRGLFTGGRSFDDPSNLIIPATVLFWALDHKVLYLHRLYKISCLAKLVFDEPTMLHPLRV